MCSISHNGEVMVGFLKWNRCNKCGYTGNMDSETDTISGKEYCICPVCHKKIYNEK